MLAILIAFQDWILSASPGLFPLFGMAYSFITSAHCSVMCAPLLASRTGRGEAREPYFVGRLISYTAVGLWLGYCGSWLRQSLEFKVIAAVAFVVFGYLTLLLFLPRFFKWPRRRPDLGGRTPFWHGILSVGLPCHSLVFMYSLAALSGNAWGGGLLLFSHAVMTMPALTFSLRFITRLGRARPWAPRAVKWIVVFLSLLNMAYFSARLFMTDEAARQRIFFCF